MTQLSRGTAALTMLALLGSLILPGTASASSKGRRNTALVLGALTVHQALHHKTGNALLLGAGTAYAYKRYKDDKKSEDRRSRYRRYSSVHHRYRR